MELNFVRKKVKKCLRCGKPKGDHAAIGSGCPIGGKTRCGYISFSQIDTFLGKEEMP